MLYSIGRFDVCILYTFRSIVASIGRSNIFPLAEVAIIVVEFVVTKSSQKSESFSLTFKFNSFMLFVSTNASFP